MSNMTILGRKSNLEITGSFGEEFTADVPKAKNLTAGVTHQAFQITDHNNGQKTWLNFRGLGAGTSVGLSILGAFGISASKESDWSQGTYLYDGVLNYGEVELDELINRDVLIFSGSVSAVKSGGVTLIIFRPLPILPVPLAWHSFAGIAGLSLSSSFGAGLMQYYGFVTKQ